VTEGPAPPPPPPPIRDGNEPPPPPFDPASLVALKPVGITLVVYNALSIANGLVGVLLLPVAQRFMAEMAKKDKQMQGVADLYAQPWMMTISAVGLLLAIVALIGSIYLLRGRMYGLAMTGAIVTMVNPGGACCCLFGLGLGIWAVAVLVKPEVQAAFNRP